MSNMRPFASKPAARMKCTFTMDEKIAWGHYTIPEHVFSGQTLDDWFPLNGKQGEEKEGKINFVLSFVPIRPAQMLPGSQVVVVPAHMYGIPSYYVPGATTPPQPPITDEDVKQIHEVFPNFEDEVIRSVLQANNGNKNATINSLIQLSGGN